MSSGDLDLRKPMPMHPAGQPSPGDDRIKSVQFLRFVAATLVVLYHTDLQISRLSGVPTSRFQFAAAGTDLLFVISGFVMVYICHRRRFGFGEFVFRRFARIAPLYWLLTLSMLAAFLLAPGLFHTTAFDPWHLLASLLFLPYPHPVLGIQRPFLFPGWALNYFMFFYVLFGAFLFLPTRPRIVAVSLVLCSLTLAWLGPGASPLLDFYGAPIILDFVLGMLAGWAFLERRTLGPLAIALVLMVSALVFAAGALGGVSTANDRMLYWGVADAGLLIACVFIEKQWGWWHPPLVTLLGEASFAIYLSNLFALGVVTEVMKAAVLFPLLGTAGAQVLLLVCALALGLALSVAVERPLQNLVLRHRISLLCSVRRLLGMPQSH